MASESPKPTTPAAAVARHVEWLEYALAAARDEELRRRGRLDRATDKNRDKRVIRLAEVSAEIVELAALVRGIKDLQTAGAAPVQKPRAAARPAGRRAPARRAAASTAATPNAAATTAAPKATAVKAPAAKAPTKAAAAKAPAKKATAAKAAASKAAAPKSRTNGKAGKATTARATAPAGPTA
jgi:hypothetical protein